MRPLASGKPIDWFRVADMPKIKERSRVSRMLSLSEQPSTCQSPQRAYASMVCCDAKVLESGMTAGVMMTQWKQNPISKSVSKGFLV